MTMLQLLKAVLNSIKSLNKYSKNYDVNLINSFGEWKNFKDENKEIKFIDLFLAKIINFNRNIAGFLKSRLFYLFVGIFSFKSLYNLIKKNKPDYLIIHLLTFVPLILLIFSKFDTKFILRISGYPKLNFLERFFGS